VGVQDLPEDWAHRCREVVDFLPKRLAEYERLIKSSASS
jgi:NADH:ubiquinone oxidoreductase subunit D